MLGGALLGLGLGALLSSMGLGGAMASMISTILMVALLGAAAMFVYRMWRKKTGNDNGMKPAFAAAGMSGNGSDSSFTPEIASRIEPAQKTAFDAAPLAGASASGTGASGAWTGNSIDIYVSAADNTAVASIKIYGDGSYVDQVTCGGATCSGVVWWLTGPLASGTHTITAVAVDTAGNQATTPPVTINK